MFENAVNLSFLIFPEVMLSGRYLSKLGSCKKYILFLFYDKAN